MPTPPNLSDDALLADLFERAYLGNITARNRIFEIVNPGFYLLRIAKDELNAGYVRGIDPADVVQDALAHGIQCYAAFPGHSRRAFRLWLQRIIHFKLLSAQRDAARRARHEVPLTADDALRPAATLPPPQQLEQQESRAEMQCLVARLSPADQHIIRLRVFDNRSFEDIGHLLSCSENAAQKRFVRAFQRVWLQISAPPQ